MFAFQKMLSNHNNLSAGAQNTKYYRQLCINYARLQALVNNAPTWQSNCMIVNNALKTAKGIYPRKFTME